MSIVKAFLSVFLAAGAVSCSVKVDEKTLDRFGLNCPVKSVSVAPDTSLSLVRDDYYKAEFNRKGSLTELKYYFPDGRVMSYELYRYDRKGRKIELLPFDKDSTATGRYAYEYDGRFVSKCTLFGMNSADAQRWENKNDGKHITETRFYQEGEFESLSKSVYKGNVRDETVTDAEGGEVGRSRYVYLSEDKPLEIESPLLKISVRYNKTGLPVKASGVSLSSKGDFEWHQDATGTETFVYEYEYDSRGNWIVRKEFSGPEKKLDEVLSRTIEY